MQQKRSSVASGPRALTPPLSGGGGGASRNAGETPAALCFIGPRAPDRLPSTRRRQGGGGQPHGTSRVQRTAGATGGGGRAVRLARIRMTLASAGAGFSAPPDVRDLSGIVP